MKLSQLKIDPEFQSKIPPLQFEEEQQLEHFIYPQVAQWLCNGQLTWENGQAYFTHKLLEKPIQFA